MRAMRALALTFALAGFATTAHSQERLGIVLMHGKDDLPGRLAPLARALSATGYLVERPEMCWSRRRIYDHSYLDCLHDAENAMDKLKAAGATGIVLAGVGLGGGAAIAFGARHDDLKGVIAIGPAPAIEFMTRRPAVAASYARAQKMIASGHGDRKAIFTEVKLGRTFDVETTANIYASFVGPDSPGIMTGNAAKLKMPLLVITGVYDPRQRPTNYVFALAPANPHNWHVMVPADPRRTVGIAPDIIPAWLKVVLAPPSSQPGSD